MWCHTTHNIKCGSAFHSSPVTQRWDLMDSGFICGDVIVAAVLLAEMSSDLICTRGEAEWVASGEPGKTTAAAVVVLVRGFWDQLGSSLICQLSLMELARIRDEITLSKQAVDRRVSSGTRRSSFNRSSVSKTTFQKDQIKQKDFMQFNDTKCNKWHPRWCSGWCCSVSRVEFSGLRTGASVSILQVPPTVQKCARHG